MSTIAHYFRATEETLESLRGKDWLESVLSSGNVVDVDKAVWGLEWLLSRLPAAPVDGGGFSMRRNLAARLMGGEKEPSLRSPMGPSRTLRPDAVRELEEWLRPIDLSVIQPLFDAAAMMEAEVYPQVWDEPGILEDYLVPNLNRLKEFLQSATRENQSVLMFFL